MRTVVFTCFTCFVIIALGTPNAIGAEESVRERGPERGMTLVQAIVLGAVEGMTEYLPVSSTGHLLVVQSLMGLDKTDSDAKGDAEDAKTAADAYAICIQAGAIIAVLGLYNGRVMQMVYGILGKDMEGLRMAFITGVAFLPAAIIGVAFDDSIKAYLFGMWPVVAAWLVGGLAILAVTWWKRESRERITTGKSLEQLNIRMGLVIGLMQCIAMWPGVSRSLITIVGGVLVGLSLPAAVEFSFLLGLVTLGAATSYDALKHGGLMLQTFDVLSLGMGLIAAFIFAVLSIKWMVAYLNRHSLAIFGYYRVLVAMVVAVLIALRVI
jgi:undecaprenyl-diphosphatase